MQCTSGTSATYDCSGNNEVGLVFDGTNRELRTCNFNLASRPVARGGSGSSEEPPSWEKSPQFQ